MKTLELNAIDLRSENAVYETSYDDLERPVPAPEPTTFPITVFVDELREFYPRKAGKSGTRLVYKNGAAQVVKESYAEVRVALASLNN